MARRVKMPDGTFAQFPDDATDSEILAFAEKAFPAKKSFRESFIQQVKEPTTPETFKEMLARAAASPTLPGTRQRLKEAREPGQPPKAKDGKVSISAVPFFDPESLKLTEADIEKLEAPERFLVNLFTSKPLQAARGAIEDVVDFSLGRLAAGVTTRTAGLATRKLGAKESGTKISDLGRIIQGKPTISAEKLAKEEGIRVANIKRSGELVKEKLARASKEAKEAVDAKKAQGKELLQVLKSGSKEEKAKIKEAFGVTSIAAAMKSIRESMRGIPSVEKQVQKAITELPLEESSLLVQKDINIMTKDIVKAMSIDDPVAFERAVASQIKNIDDINTKEFFTLLEENRRALRGNKTLDDVVRQFREDFSKALPEDARLGKGLEVAGRGREVIKTPFTANVGTLAPEIEQASTTASPLLMTLSRWLRPESVLSSEKAGAELYSLTRVAEIEGTTFTGRLQKVVMTEGAKHTKDRREAIGRYLDGQATLLSPAEIETAGKLRKITDFIADKAGIPKEKRVKDYLTRFMDVEETGLPLDVIESMAHGFAMDEARAGNLGVQAAKFVKNLPSLKESKASMGAKLFGQLDDFTRSQLLKRARNTLKGTPSEIFYGPLSASRTKHSKLITEDFQEVLLKYIPGAFRKIEIDRLLAWQESNAIRLSPELRHYVSEYLDAFRGVMGSTELMSTLAFERWATQLENSGSKILPKIARTLKPRKLSGLVRKWQFNAKIGGNMATALVNLSQTAVNTVTEIGFKRTSKAIAEYLSGGPRVTKVLERAGIIRQPHLGDIDPGQIDSVTKVLSFMFQQTEEFNRGVAYLAGFGEARAVGKSLKEAIKAGQKLVDDTQFVFSKANIPLKFQDPYWAILFQFKNYVWNQLQFIKRITLNAGKEPEKFLRFMATLGMVGGVKAYTTAALGSYIISNVEETEWDDWIKNTVMFGLPGAAGVDISESIGLRIFPTAPGAPQDTQRAVREIAGPTGAVISETLFSGVVGEVQRWITSGEHPDPEVMKKFNRTILKNLPGGVAADRFLESDEPFRGRRERLQVEETPKDRTLRALFGARTTAVSKERELTSFLRGLDEEAARRSRLVKDDIINNINDIRAGRYKVQQSMDKYGAKLQDIPLDSLGEDIINREMPNLVRQFDSLPISEKRRVRQENPALFDRIMLQKRRAADRVREFLKQ